MARTKKLSEYSDQAIRLLAARFPDSEYADEARRRGLKFMVKGEPFASMNEFNFDFWDLGVVLGSEEVAKRIEQDIRRGISFADIEAIRAEIIQKVSTGELTPTEAIELMSLIDRLALKKPMTSFGFIKGKEAFIFRDILLSGKVVGTGAKKSYEAVDAKKLQDIFKTVWKEGAERGKSLPSLILGLVNKASDTGWLMLVSSDYDELEKAIDAIKRSR